MWTRGERQKEGRSGDDKRGQMMEKDME